MVTSTVTVVTSTEPRKIVKGNRETLASGLTC